MAEQIIELRGHHLIPLYIEFSKKEGQIPDNKSFEFNAIKYNDRFATELSNLYNHLLIHPEQKIKIIKGIDFLCNICPKKTEQCKNSIPEDSKDRDFGDAEVANEFGLEVGKIYNMESVEAKLDTLGRRFYMNKIILPLMQERNKFLADILLDD